MKKAITLNDIACVLHLSRNTVSKALNGKYVPAKTRRLVLDTAVRMGYKSFDVIAPEKSAAEEGKILILSSVPLISANYYIYLIRGIMSEAEGRSLEVLQYIFRPNSDLETLKEYIRQFDVNGIICIEFFTRRSADKILSLGIPTVFMDHFYGDEDLNGEYDIVLPDNVNAVRSACKKLIAAGADDFSFIGNPRNCKSFYERFLGMREALYEEGLPYSPELSLTRDNSFPYGSAEALAEAFSRFVRLPDCFVCANDFIALSVIDALKQMKKLHLDKINVLGFDNIPESRLSSPKLSTINIDKQVLGRQAVCTLMDRISNPALQSRTIGIFCNYIQRETTMPLLRSPLV